MPTSGLGTDATWALGARRGSDWAAAGGVWEAGACAGHGGGHVSCEEPVCELARALDPKLLVALKVRRSKVLETPLAGSP